MQVLNWKHNTEYCVSTGISKMRKHLACVKVTLILFPDVIFYLTLNYPDLVKSEHTAHLGGRKNKLIALS